MGAPQRRRLRGRSPPSSPVDTSEVARRARARLMTGDRRARDRGGRARRSSAAPCIVKVPATSANLGPGFDTLGLALARLRRARRSTALTDAATLEVEVHGVGAGEVPRDESNLVVRSIALRLRRRRASRCRAPARGAQRHPARPGPRLVGRGGRRRACWRRRACSRAIVEFGARRRCCALATELEGHPDNVAPALFGGLTIAWVTTTGPQHKKLSCTAASRRWCSCPSSRCRRASRAACSPCGAARGRRVQRLAVGAAHRGAHPEPRAAARRRPRTSCTRTTARRRCPRPTGSSACCARRGFRPSSRARARAMLVLARTRSSALEAAAPRRGRRRTPRGRRCMLAVDFKGGTVREYAEGST